MRYLLLSSLLLTAPLALRAQTTSLTVVNFNFETGGLTDGGFSNGTTGTIPSGWAAIPGNAPSGGNYGYFNPQDSAYAGTTGDPITSGTIGTMSGPNVFYFGSSTTGQGIQQSLTSNFALNTSYSLTFSLGCRSSNAFQASVDVQILAGTQLLASGTFRNSTVNTFTDSTIAYTGSAANAAFVGQPLIVRFAENDTPAGTAEVDIDNIRVFATNVVPEPSTWTMLGIGAAGLLGWNLRRRRVSQIARGA